METILIVDDTNANITILIELLGNNYDILVSKNGKTALEMADENRPDLILLDVMMPEMDGFEVCKKLKENPELTDIPIIFLTAKSDENSIEMAYELGGSDYVTKPFRAKELRSRVKRELKVKKLQKELKVLASTDSMTQLYNRRHFTQVSEHIFALARREKKALSLIIIDIDTFKNINDIYGHKVGDEVIITFAEILKKSQRQSDIACRFGGEEFVVLLPDTPIKDAKSVAEKIRTQVERIIMKTPFNETFGFTVSLGVSSVLVDIEDDIELALFRADEALYEAKQKGRNCVCESEQCTQIYANLFEHKYGFFK